MPAEEYPDSKTEEPDTEAITPLPSSKAEANTLPLHKWEVVKSSSGTLFRIKIPSPYQNPVPRATARALSYFLYKLHTRRA